MDYVKFIYPDIANFSTILAGWLFLVQRPFETVFQSISGRLPERRSLRENFSTKYFMLSKFYTNESDIKYYTVVYPHVLYYSIKFIRIGRHYVVM